MNFFFFFFYYLFFLIYCYFLHFFFFFFFFFFVVVVVVVAVIMLFCEYRKNTNIDVHTFGSLAQTFLLLVLLDAFLPDGKLPISVGITWWADTNRRKQDTRRNSLITVCFFSGRPEVTFHQLAETGQIVLKSSRVISGV